MARINEQERLHELTKREREFWNAGIYPAGMDEVGFDPDLRLGRFFRGFDAVLEQVVDQLTQLGGVAQDGRQHWRQSSMNHGVRLVMDVEREYVGDQRVEFERRELR